MRALGVHHVDLRVTDYGRSVRFYNGILLPLGFRKAYVEGEKVTYYIRRETVIGIREVKRRRIKDIAYSYKRAGIHHLAVAVESRAAVDQFYALLRRQRVRILYQPKFYPQYGEAYYAVFFLDPDGIDLEVMHWPNHTGSAAGATLTRAGWRSRS
jgi:catechol 2,3-dioxygenase-like lactoylglutathione lyase family enzyme